VEDLGGGLAAVFGFEHRFNPDTGTDASGAAAKFWNGYSNVGLRGGFGAVTLGRHYTAAFTDVQNQVDPFGGDTVAALRDIGMRQGTTTKVRVDDSIRYDIAASGFKFAASIAEATQSGANAGPDRPFSFAASYAGGPLWVGLGYENPANANDKSTSAGIRYTFAPVTLRAGLSNGTDASNNKVKGYLVGATINVGAAGSILAGYSTVKTASTTQAKKLAVGYRHNLSKRTFLYVDFARDSKVVTEKTGYDFGLQHNF
jgi:predicted porin